MKNQSNQSGTYDPVKYPELININDVQLPQNMIVYIVEPYNLEGYSIAINKTQGHYCIKIGDWNGNIIDGDNLDPIRENLVQFLSVIATCNIESINIFLSHTDDKYVIVDALQNGKLLSPGMISDLFAAITPIQKVVEINELDKQLIESYKGHIVKPSRPRLITTPKGSIPLILKIDA